MPTVLVTTTTKWFPTARLGMALDRAGFEVEILAPKRHPITKTRVVRRAYVYDAFSPLLSFHNAIQNGKPDLVVPSDDFATQHLHDLYHQQKGTGNSGRSVCELIERSLGSQNGFPAIRSRASLIAIAREEGVRVPITAEIPDIAILRKWIAERALPVVLKTDGSSSGEGVRVPTTPGQAERAFRALQSPLSFVRMTKRALINRDLRWILPTLERRHSVVNAQEFIEGRDATSVVACWKGEVLAGLHFEVMIKQYVRGPASVLRVIDNIEMVVAIQKIVRRLCLSGLQGFDFLLKGNADTPYLIEMNPRATQVGHLALGTGRDLPAALYSALTGKAIQEAPSVTSNSTIVLFPQEWLRNPESSYLRSGYHDIPWEEPELIRECLRKAQKWTDWRSPEELALIDR
jgi:ATP-grasp domain